MKKILNHLWNMMGFAIGSALTAWICFMGINMTIEAWQRPWPGFFDVIIMPLACLFFGGMSIFIGCFSIICFIGIFKAKAWSKKHWLDKDEISKVKKYQNFGLKMKSKSTDYCYYFCFVELLNTNKYVIVYNENSESNNKYEENVRSVSVQPTDKQIPWNSMNLGFINWFESHYNIEYSPIDQAPDYKQSEYFYSNKGQGKVIVDFYNEYIKNDKHETTDLIEVS